MLVLYLEFWDLILFVSVPNRTNDPWWVSHHHAPPENGERSRGWSDPWCRGKRDSDEWAITTQHQRMGRRRESHVERKLRPLIWAWFGFVIQWIALECFFKTCASSSSLLSSPLFLVSSLISSSIPYHGHSGNVLDNNDEMNALTGAVADKLMKT